MNDSDPLQVFAVGAEAAEMLARIHAVAFEEPWNADAIAVLIASPLVFALQAGAPPIGFILARSVAGEAEILTLAVDPSDRRRGVGCALVEAAAATALAAGAQTLWLEVAQDNTPARSLYARAGFEQVGRRPAYYRRPGGPVDALLLRRHLNTAPA